MAFGDFTDPSVPPRVDPGPALPCRGVALRGRSLGRLAALGSSLLLTGLALACQGEGGKPGVLDGNDLKIPRGDGDGDGNPVAMEEFNQPGAPDVVVSIDESSELIFTSAVAVTCGVTQSTEAGAKPVDVETIQAVLLDEEGAPVLTEVPTAGASTQEYLAEFATADLAAGAYTVRCVAADSSDAPKVGMDERVVYIDKGPSIEIIKPVEDEALSAVGGKNFEFRILSAELFDGDADAALDTDSLQVLINGEAFSLAAKEGAADTYWVSGLDLSSSMNFPTELPRGETLVTVRATNERGVQAELSYSVTIDSKGPTIVVRSPTRSSIVGATAEFRFEITDDYSGVDWSTLTVTPAIVGADPIPFDTSTGRWSRDGKIAILRTPTLEISGSRDLNFNVDVQDLAGNAALQVDADYKIDSVGPLLSLDTPYFRKYDDEDGSCSASFDPLGPAAIDHGDNVYEFARIRGFAIDRGNLNSSSTTYVASVEKASVNLWLAPATVGALVIDADGDADGYCDSVTNDALAQTADMTPIAPQGKAYFSDGTGEPSASPSMAAICSFKNPPQTTPPDPRCTKTADMSLVIAAGPRDWANEPVIYGLNPSGNASPNCLGAEVEVQNFVGGTYEGWVCAALAAVDEVGNENVSAPIAFCFDNGMIEGEPPCWGQGAGSAPSCTDGCTPEVLPAGGMIIE